MHLTDTEIEVMATVGGFLNDHLPDRFCAGRPQFDQDGLVWKTPILLSYPTLGPLGQVGEITVSVNASEILSFTPLEEMKAAARAIIEQRREEIESPLPSSFSAEIASQSQRAKAWAEDAKCDNRSMRR